MPGSKRQRNAVCSAAHDTGCIATLIREENIRLFESHGVFDEEMHSRYEIMMEEYVKTLHIEDRR
ncbi:MAG: hypothetical protein ACLVJ6_00460 [Merdibacter sp.]